MKKVKIYTWTFCPFCIQAKNILNERKIEFEEIVIDGDKKALKELKKETDCGSVPQIFVENEFIGGCDDLKLLIKKSKFDEVFKY